MRLPLTSNENSREHLNDFRVPFIVESDGHLTRIHHSIERLQTGIGLAFQLGGGRVCAFYLYPTHGAFPTYYDPRTSPTRSRRRWVKHVSSNHPVHGCDVVPDDRPTAQAAEATPADA